MSAFTRSVPGRAIRRPLIFGAAVLLLVYGLCGMLELFDAWQLRREDDLKRHLRLELDRAIALRATGSKLFNSLWSIHELNQSGFGRNIHFSRTIDRLEQRRGGTFSLFLFQNARNTLTYPKNASNSVLVADLLSAMRAPASRRFTLAPPLDRRATALWGREATVENLRRNNGGYILLESAGRRGIAYFVVYGSGLGEALIAENLPAPQVDAFLRNRNRSLSLTKNSGQGIPDIEFWVPPPNRSVRSIRMAWEKANAEKQDAVKQNGTLWLFDRDRMGTVTAIASPLPASHDMALLRTACISICIILPLFSFYGYRRGLNPAFASLRVQMQALFLIATLLPMLSTLGVGWMSLGDQEERLRNAAFAKGITKLHTINAGFSRTLAIFREKFMELWRVANRHPFDVEGFNQRLAPLEEARMCRLLLIYDSNNRVLLRKIDADRDDIVAMSTLMARITIRRFIPERIGEGEHSKILPIDLLIEQMTTTPEFGWSTLVETPNALHRLQAGFSPADVIWNVFPDLATGPAFMMGMADSEDLIRLHLTYSVLVGADAMRLVLLDAAHSEMPPNIALETFSSISTVMQTHRLSGNAKQREVSPLPGELMWPQQGTPDRRALMTLMQVSHLTDKILQREIRLGSGTAWVVAAPDVVLGKYVTAAVLDAEQELSSLNGTRLALLIGLLVSLLTSFAAGQLLSALVLVPIADLQEGIDAIRRRRADVAIPFRRDDEFGHLAKIFNHALGEMKELELARVVQTSLLPATIPEIVGYTLAAVNISATDLSGDYYDLVRCPDGSLLMVIGDVTGHGASAALAMAMAKATVAYRLADGENGPTALLTSLNDVFFQDLRQQRKYMTMLMVRLDPLTHLLTVESAGHNYPLHHGSASRKTEYLPMVGFPLGVRAKSQRDTLQRTLAPGDVFIMYTDGYTECMLPDGEQLGDETLRQIAGELAGKGKNAREILDGLLMELDIRRVPGPLGDDVTLVILRRNR